MQSGTEKWLGRAELCTERCTAVLRSGWEGQNCALRDVERYQEGEGEEREGEEDEEEEEEGDEGEEDEEEDG